MNLSELDQIKRLAIISVFSNDTLMNILVLKGGNALDIIYKIAPRASIDLDFSTEKDLGPIEEFTCKISNSLRKIFRENGFEVFDIKVIKKPKIDNPETSTFWGGYKIEFKVANKETYLKYEDEIDNLRNHSTVIGPRDRKIFSIDISKWEYCKNKQSFELDGYTIYVYSPEMIVFEKIRAICQQMPEYIKTIGKSYQTARARDFFDIYTVLDSFKIKLTSPENIKLLQFIFEQKKVDLSLINNIKHVREFHRTDFSVVKDTVKPLVKLEEFDFYFDYVVEKCELLYQAFKKE